MSTDATQPVSVGPQRPLPTVAEPDTRAFWLATKNHELTYQVCNWCGGLVFYPRSHCTHCLSAELTVKTSQGAGAIYTFTVIRQHGDPFFRQQLPYVVALVDLDEGFRIFAEVATDTETVRVGARVSLDWEDHDQVAIPIFRVVTDA